nr:unnamed protein product [Callosobruchus analis]
MVFTERQKTELKTIAKEMIREMMQDKDFTEMLAGILADKISQKINKEIDILTTRVRDLEQKIDIIQGDRDEINMRLEEMEQSKKNTQLRILGIPESNEDCLETQLKHVFKTKLGITDDITIEQCYRTGPATVKNRTVPRAIIAKRIKYI